MKFFLGNAAAETPVQTLLLVGFSRWRVERCFEDQKQEVGLDQWEGRRWLGLKWHLLLSSISYLFLARVREEWREKKSGADRVPGPPGGSGVSGTGLRGRLRAALIEAAAKDIRHRQTTPRRGPPVAYRTNPQETAENGHLSQRPYPLQVALNAEKIMSILSIVFCQVPPAKRVSQIHCISPTTSPASHRRYCRCRNVLKPLASRSCPFQGPTKILAA